MHKYLLLLLIATPLSHAGTCSQGLDDVIARYVVARGGSEALEKQRALRIVSTHYEGKYQPVLDYRVLKPGYMWVRATYRDGFIYTEGFDGERAWEQPGADQPAEYVGGDAARALNQGAMSPVHLYGLQHMAGLGAKMALRGCESIDGRDYFVVNVLSRFGTDIDYYIDADSYRLARSRTVRPLHPTQDPTPITIEERWSDFRLVNGVLHPFVLEQWNVTSGERLTRLEIDSIEQLPDATAADFARPE